MRVPRVYTKQTLAVGALQLDHTAAHYLSTVLRLKVGRELVLFNGDGNNYAARISDVDRKLVVVDVESIAPNPCDDLVLPVHLGIAISRGERMDWVMQKATELGVTEVTPLFSERVEVKLDDKRLAKKLGHWHEIIVNACAQSGRSVVPRLHEAITATDWQPSSELKWVLAPGKQTMAHTDRPASVALLVGPEGGLTEIEIQSAVAKGFETVTLGPRILRTETAPVVALSMLQSRWGDLAGS